MIELTDDELRQYYEAVVKSSGHPDAIGYMARVLLTSGGNPDYYDPATGKQGLMPVDPILAKEMVGAAEVQSLQSNLPTTIAMDRLFFEKYSSINDMIIAFQFGETYVSQEYTGEHRAFLDDVDESRDLVYSAMYPPLATVDDVIETLNNYKLDSTISKEHKEFYTKLLTKDF